MQRRSDLSADPRFASYLGRLYGTESDASVLGLRSDVDLIYRPSDLGITLGPIPSYHRLRHCPANASLAYADFNVHAPLNDTRDGWFVAWYTRPRLARSKPVGDNTWTEVTHCAGSFFETTDGAWHYVSGRPAGNARWRRDQRQGPGGADARR